MENRLLVVRGQKWWQTGSRGTWGNGMVRDELEHKEAA